jgi:glutamate racemase
LQITNFLLEKKVKMLLVACNSVSASALQTILDHVRDLPVLDVITAGTDAALAGNSHKIGIIGTLATIGSHAYDKALKAKNPEIEVVSEACPLLVPLAEEGWIDNEVARETLQIYLAPFKQQSPDTLILGCTHYPLFKNAIRRQLANPDIHIIDSALSIAHSARETLEKHKLTNPQSTAGNFRCYVSDKPQRFQQLAERFLGRKIPDVNIVSLS